MYAQFVLYSQLILKHFKYFFILNGAIFLRCTSPLNAIVFYLTPSFISANILFDYNETKEFGIL